MGALASGCVGPAALASGSCTGERAVVAGWLELVGTGRSELAPSSSRFQPASSVPRVQPAKPQCRLHRHSIATLERDRWLRFVFDIEECSGGMVALMAIQ
jgi:hypothetical protein